MTGWEAPTESVQVLDLRGWTGDDLPPVSGLVVAVDDESTLHAHHAAYYALVDDDQVHGLLCLVVGAVPDDPSGRDGAVLRAPDLLRRNAAVLWVGDEHGVTWGTGIDRPHPARRDQPTGLERLVDALRAPELFERVYEVVRTFNDRAASPGFHLYSHTVNPRELREAVTRAVDKLTEVRGDTPQPPALRDPAQFAGEAQAPGAQFVSPSPVDAARSRVAQDLDAAEESARRMVRVRAVRGRDRPGDVLGDQLLAAAEGAERYRALLVELLHRMDGHLRVEQPPVEEVLELGLRRPPAPRPEAISTAVRDVVRTTLARHPSLPTLAAQLRGAAAMAAPQGCSKAWSALRDRPPIVRTVPPFRRWVLPLWTLPLIFLSCLALVVLPSVTWVGYVLGIGFAALWFGAGWILLARRPDGGGELGKEDAALPALSTYGAAGLLGAGLGIAAMRLVPDALRPLVAPSPAYPAGVAVATLLVIGLLFALSWTGAVRRWVAAMDLPGLRGEVERMTTDVSAVVTTQWMPSARHRQVEMAFSEVAAALLETAEVLRTRGTRAAAAADGLPSASATVRPLPPELLGVVGTDLVGLTDHVITSAWRAIESSQRSPRGAYRQRAIERLDDYAAHIAAGGFLTKPAFVPDRGPRDRLIARQWADDPAAVAAVRARAADEMTQLCQARQLRSIDREENAGLLRFAPLPVRAVLEADPTRNRTILEERPIWTAANDHAGSLRLLPLRLGSVDTREPVGRHE